MSERVSARACPSPCYRSQPRMRDSAFISNEMCPHARTRLTFLVLKRTTLTTLFFAFQVITSTCLEICSPLRASWSHVTCIPTGYAVVCPCLSMRGSGEVLVVTSVISVSSRPSLTKRSYIPFKRLYLDLALQHTAVKTCFEDVGGLRSEGIQPSSRCFTSKCRKRLF